MYTHIYISTHIDEKAKVNTSGCGVILYCKPDTVNTYRRDYGYVLGSSPRRLCCIQAVRLALTTVMPKYRSLPVALHTDDDVWRMLLIPSEQLGEMCETDQEFEALDQMNIWWDRFENISVHPADPDNVDIVQSLKLATDAIAIGRNFDSGTTQRNSWLPPQKS